MDDYLAALPPDQREAGRLDGYDLAKGTIRFTPDHPVPDDVIVDLVAARMREL